MEKVLWVREPYVEAILEGRKTIEVRVAGTAPCGYPNISRLRPGDTLILNNRHRVAICRIAQYRDLEELLAHEEASVIAPDLTPGELRAAFRDLYPPKKEALGVVALEVRLPPEAQDC